MARIHDIRGLFATLVIAVGLAGCATTPSEDPVLIKLTELDQRLERVERVTQNDSLVQLAGEVTQLQAEVRELRGEVETLRYELDQAAQRQRDQYLDIDRRLQALERGGTAGGSAAAPAMPPGPGGAVPEAAAPAAAGADREQYDAAFELLKEGRYEQAREAFQRFLADHPGSDLAGHGQYWLAETWYVTQDYRSALPAFRKVVEQYPNSRKLPDALLKIGYSQYELGQYDAARRTLSQVVERYPDTTAARLAAQRLTRMDSEGR